MWPGDSSVYTVLSDADDHMRLSVIQSLFGLAVALRSNLPGGSQRSQIPNSIQGVGPGWGSEGGRKGGDGGEGNGHLIFANRWSPATTKSKRHWKPSGAKHDRSSVKSYNIRPAFLFHICTTDGNYKLAMLYGGGLTERYMQDAIPCCQQMDRVLPAEHC